MRLSLIAPVFGASLFFVSALFAQHSDIEFGYDSLGSPSAFVIENDRLTLDGIQFWESEFEPDPLDPTNFFSDEPGFFTNAAEGLFVTSGDQIRLRVLNASGTSAYGVGLVNFYNPNTGMLEASASHRLLAEQNTGALPNLIFNGLGIESPANSNPLFLGEGDASNSIHDHIMFDLLDDGTAPLGAYGVLFQLEADFASNGFGQTDLTSDPFWIIWNHGMDPGDFENGALPAFGAIPEPSSLLVLGLSAIGMSLRRRRK